MPPLPRSPPEERIHTPVQPSPNALMMVSKLSESGIEKWSSRAEVGGARRSSIGPPTELNVRVIDAAGMAGATLVEK